MFTVKPYYSPAQQLKLESAFCVIDNQHISFHRKSNGIAAGPGPIPAGPGVEAVPIPEFVPTKSVQTGLSVFSSEKAYKDGAQSLHSRSVSLTIGIAATEEEVSAAILQELITAK